MPRTAPCSRLVTAQQQRVADRMAERVVDGLEAVEIEEQHGELLAAAASACSMLLAEQHAVGQIGERVVARHVHDLRLGPAPLGDVLEGRDPAAVRGRAVRHAGDDAAVAELVIVRAASRAG